MEKWEEIMSKCEKWKLNKTCTFMDNLCVDFKTCPVRAEQAEFQRTGNVGISPEKKSEHKQSYCPVCPLSIINGNLIVCLKERCEFFMQIPPKYPNPMSDPCCGFVALVESIVQLRISVDEIKGVMESKLT